MKKMIFDIGDRSGVETRLHRADVYIELLMIILTCIGHVDFSESARVSHLLIVIVGLAMPALSLSIIWVHHYYYQSVLFDTFCLLIFLSYACGHVNAPFIIIVLFYI